MSSSDPKDRSLVRAPEGPPIAVPPPVAPAPFFRRHSLWIIVIQLGILGLILLSIFPLTSLAWLVTSLTVSALSLLVMVLAVVRMAPGSKAVWIAFIASMALTLVGDALYNTQTYYSGTEPEGLWSDALYLGALVAAFVGLVIQVRRVHPGHDDEAWTDTAILTLAGLAFVATFAVAEDVTAESLFSQDSLIALLYPVFDIVLLSALVRLALTGARRNLSVILITASYGLYAVADIIYNTVVVHVTVHVPLDFMESLYVFAAVLMAAAAVAPDAYRIAAPAPLSTYRAGSRRIVWLSLGAITVPIFLIYAVWSEHADIVVKILASLAFLVVGLVLFRVRVLLRRVEEQSDMLREQARTDALTNLPNRRTLDFHLARTAREPHERLTVAMFDIDFFKAYNDSRGHQAADALLAQVAGDWGKIISPPLFLARYGGEEFTAVLPNLPDLEVWGLLEQCRVVMPDGQSVSIGFATQREDEHITDTLRRADAAMYEAKRQGRNRVVSFEDIRMTEEDRHVGGSAVESSS